ncbi:MAG: endonuclease VII domain-containing protein [Labilithrix sp.]|nr:endonuclease VII domain-containing protein [Labilithrix sp.]MCW5816443.1 endonuclease VII domain-containing protein [Labilithrix sp.]
MPRKPINQGGVCATCGSTDLGTRNRCRPCRARASRERWAANLLGERESSRLRTKAWRAENPLKVQAQDRRRRYGVTTRDVRAMLAAQDGRCAICRAPDPGCVDHCHDTRRVRGMLCRKCNAGLGQFRDDPRLLRAAIRYLEHHGKALDIGAETDDVSRPSRACLVSSVGRAGD